MERLFVYGTLRPGHENAYILENIGGDWLRVMWLAHFMRVAGALPRDSQGSYWTITGHASAVIYFYLIISRRTGQCWMSLKRATIALRLWLLQRKTSRLRHGFISYCHRQASSVINQLRPSPCPSQIEKSRLRQPKRDANITTSMLRVSKRP